MFDFAEFVQELEKVNYSTEASMPIIKRHLDLLQVEGANVEATFTSRFPVLVNEKKQNLLEYAISEKNQKLFAFVLSLFVWSGGIEHVKKTMAMAFALKSPNSFRDEFVKLLMKKLVSWCETLDDKNRQWIDEYTRTSISLSVDLSDITKMHDVLTFEYNQLKKELQDNKTAFQEFKNSVHYKNIDRSFLRANVQPVVNAIDSLVQHKKILNQDVENIKNDKSYMQYLPLYSMWNQNQIQIKSDKVAAITEVIGALKTDGKHSAHDIIETARTKHPYFFNGIIRSRTKNYCAAVEAAEEKASQMLGVK